MTASVTITVPGEPQAKGRPRFSVKNGRAFTPVKTRSYEEVIRLWARLAMRNRAPLIGPLEAIVVANFSIPASWPKAKRAAAMAGDVYPTGRPDADNIAKTLDGLNGIVITDDALIVDCVIRKRYAASPSLVFVISPKVQDAAGVA